MFLPCPSRLLPVRVKYISFASQEYERIAMKFPRVNHYHRQIKRLYFGRNWNRDKEAGFDRIFESTSVGVA